MVKTKGWTGLFCALGMLGAITRAHEPAIEGDVAVPRRDLVWIEPGPPETSILYADGTEIQLQTETVTRFVCGSDTAGMTVDDLRVLAEAGRAAFADGQNTWQISPEGVRGGLNIVFSVSGGLPAGAQAALDEVALFVESQFSDPITVTVNFSMFNFGNPNVIGSTSSSYFGSPDWNTSRTGLINGMDADDTIQSSLPTGSTIPVRYDASTATVTNENRVFFTRANYNATIGSSAGSAATMQLNTGFSFDYDPSNGMTPQTMCFRSVVVHELAHALGFVSGVDFRNNDIECLDVYRFQRTDGTGTDWNPDDLSEFQSTARTVDFNNLNDDANSDIITVEYRMADGSPYQASHFREQVANIGIMDPALAFTQTFYPNYYRTSDLTMLDAIGWDHNACVPIGIDDQPDGQTVTEGQPAAFSVVASGTGPLSYQWRKGGANLSDGPAAGGGMISGADSDMLRIDAVGQPDEGDYDCVVSNGCGSQTSAVATLTVNAGVPSAAITGAVSRKSCDLPIASFNGAGPTASESRQGGVTEVRIAFDVAPAGPGASPVTIEQATCAAPGYAAYSGSATVGAGVAGNELVLTFTPGLENARSYKISVNPSVTSLAGQFIALHGLIGDVNSDGLVNATDRSVAVGVWTGSGFSCSTDVSDNGVTDATDRSLVVGAWTGGQDCAP